MDEAPLLLRSFPRAQDGVGKGFARVMEVLGMGNGVVSRGLFGPPAPRGKLLVYPSWDAYYSSQTPWGCKFGCTCCGRSAGGSCCCWGLGTLPYVGEYDPTRLVSSTVSARAGGIGVVPEQPEQMRAWEDTWHQGRCIFPARQSCAPLCQPGVRMLDVTGTSM